MPPIAEKDGRDMCVPPDSVPPIPSSGGIQRTRTLILEAADGNRFNAFEALASQASEVGVIVLPDVRGLFPFYSELASRLAEAGHDTVAIDYFGRSAGLDPREDGFDFKSHVALQTFDGVKADVAATIAHLRASKPGRKVVTIGFCIGGSNSWIQATNGLGLAGAIGFYGHPGRDFPPGGGSAIERLQHAECPILALMAGDDPGIPADLVERFREALESHGVEHEIVTYAGAPHSFFDRRHNDFAAESADAWRRVLEFLSTVLGATDLEIGVIAPI
jgi:carboxymethylenebutenolidase